MVAVAGACSKCRTSGTFQAPGKTSLAERIENWSMAADPFYFNLDIPKEFAKHLTAYCDENHDWWTQFTLHFCQDEGVTKFSADVSIGKKKADKDPSCLDVLLKAAPRDDTAPAASEKVSVCIALAGDSHPEILDTEYFETHAYIPAWDSIHDAVEALQKHLYGTTKITHYNLSLIHI